MNHIIKKQTISIDMPSGHDSWLVQDQFKEIFNRDVLPRLEQICDELDIGPLVTLKMDELSIDVGSISKEEIGSHWVQEVEKGFREELVRYKQEKIDKDASNNLVTHEESTLNIFMHLLEKGALPWWTSEDFNESPQKLLVTLLSEQPSTLVARIKASKPKSIISKRLLLQFEKQSIERLLSHFEKSGTHEVLSWIKKFCKKELGSDFQELQNLFLLTEIAITIDPFLVGSDEKKFFELLFQSFMEDEKGLIKSILNKIHKHLYIREKNNKKKRSLEEELYTSAAKKALISALSSSEVYTEQENGVSPLTSHKGPKNPEGLAEHQDSKSNPSIKRDSVDHSHENRATLPSTTLDEIFPEKIKKTLDTKEESEARNSNTNLKPGTQTNEDPETSQLEPRNRTGASLPKSESSPEELSTQDQRVWEHIERIKKQQATEQVGTSESETAAPDSQKTNEAVKAKHQGSENEKTTDHPTEKKPIADFNTNPSISTEAKSPIQSDKKPKEQQHNSLKYWQEELESIDECYIQNAGLILFWPYLGHFFKDLDLISDGDFKTESDQKKAALTLQYLVENQSEPLEYKLPLNKLLCGLPISEPVNKQLTMTDDNLLKGNALLEATIQNWPALRGTSVAGFQSSFINRSGVLKKHENHWLLQVEKKPFDMLMEQLPWPISIVKLSWMNKPIYVEW